MQREIAQFRDYVGHSWRTSSAAGTNIFALLGLMSTEVSRIVNAIALLLITALFSLVQVTARLVECLLDAWIDKCSAPGARMCIATYKTTHLAVIAAAVWWTYYTFAVRLFFDVPADLMGVQAVRDARAFGKVWTAMMPQLG